MDFHCETERERERMCPQEIKGEMEKGSEGRTERHRGTVDASKQRFSLDVFGSSLLGC